MYLRLTELLKYVTEDDFVCGSGKSIHPFCDKVKRDPLETECTDDRSSVALCNLVEHLTPLPTHYQVQALPPRDNK